MATYNTLSHLFLPRRLNLSHLLFISKYKKNQLILFRLKPFTRFLQTKCPPRPPNLTVRQLLQPIPMRRSREIFISHLPLSTKSSSSLRGHIRIVRGREMRIITRSRSMGRYDYISFSVVWFEHWEKFEAGARSGQQVWKGDR